MAGKSSRPCDAGVIKVQRRMLASSSTMYNTSMPTASHLRRATAGSRRRLAADLMAAKINPSPLATTIASNPMYTMSSAGTANWPNMAMKDILKPLNSVRASAMPMLRGVIIWAMMDVPVRSL